MMTQFLLVCLLFVPRLVWAQSGYPFLLKGKIGQLNAPAKVYLEHGTRLDSATLKNGRFELRGTTELPFPAELVVERQGKLRDSRYRGGAYFNSPDRTKVMLEPGPVVITSPDSLRKAHITGGSLTADYQRIEAVLDAIVSQKKTAPASDTPRSPVLQFAQAYKAFINANPASWMSLYALWQLNVLARPQYEEAAQLYESLSPMLRNSQPGLKYAEFLQELKSPRAAMPVPRVNRVGTVAPMFTQSTPEGRAVSLADYRGKYVLVEFWASWCGPCRKENPALVQVYDAYRGRNFDILGVSLDDEKGRAKWLKAIADDKLPWVQVSDLRGKQNGPRPERAAPILPCSRLPPAPLPCRQSGAAPGPD